MTEYEILNMVYDLIAQNPIKGVYESDHNHLTDLVDHVDEERQSIVFRDKRGYEFELQLVKTYAPAQLNDSKGV